MTVTHLAFASVQFSKVLRQAATTAQLTAQLSEGPTWINFPVASNSISINNVLEP